MPSPRRRAASVFSLLVLVGVLSGCATMPLNMGIRPDEPPIKIKIDGKPADVCVEYESYATYAQGLQVSYHSRATQNRAWLYVAGILGLGVMAASGGLAVASTAAAGTLGLLSISGGFAASSFAVLNNEALAMSYTVAANNVDQALRDSRERYLVAGSCSAALQILIAGVSNTRTHLEVARTDNAAGALARAKDQMDLLTKQIAAVQTVDLTHVTLTGEVVSVAPLNPGEKDADGKPTKTAVTITVKNVKLDQVSLGDVKVAFGSRVLPANAVAKKPDADATYTVTFTAPATKPDDADTKYLPILILQDKTRVPAKEGQAFVYP